MKNLVVIVTGASSGIGEATARQLAKHGCRLILAARRLDRLNKIAEEIKARGGIALPVETDLTEIAQIHRMVDAGLTEFGQIDVLFNNAGIGRLNWLEELDPIKDIENQVKVNLLGAVQTTRAVLPSMVTRQRGHIINMASMSGFVGTPTYTIYAASKFGMRGFSEALRREVGGLGIDVSVIYPGGVNTDFSEHVGYHRRTGIATPSWLRLSVQDVAQAVWDIIRRPKKTVIIPPLMRPVMWLNFAFPGIVDRLIEWRFTRRERG